LEEGSEARFGRAQVGCHPTHLQLSCKFDKLMNIANFQSLGLKHKTPLTLTFIKLKNEQLVCNFKADDHVL